LSSDWSSDVCSSDLCGGWALQPFRNADVASEHNCFLGRDAV
jgi:hypothetical protein